MRGPLSRGARRAEDRGQFLGPGGLLGAQLGRAELDGSAASISPLS
jgi:hypothetical protein